MRGLPRARWIAGAAVLALVVTACGGGGSSDKPSGTPGASETGASDLPQGGTFSVYLGEPAYLLPGQTNESEGGKVLQTLFSPLLTYDPKTGDLVPAVATEVPKSDDNKSWTIKLGDGWTFTDGTAVTAQSFVDAWNWAADGANATNNGYFFGPGMADVVGYADLQSTDPDGDGPETAPPPTATEMTGLKAVDDTTLQVDLNEPFSQFPLLLGYTAFYPMATACLTNADAVAACNETPIGNGPFKIDGKWDHNVSIKVVKNDTWNMDKKPNVDEVDFMIYNDPNTGYLDLQGGSLDFAGIPSEELAAAKSEFGDHYIDQASSNYTYIGFPMYDPNFGGTVGDQFGGQAKAELRQALSMAIDRQKIIDTIFNGAFTPADSLVSPVVAGYREGACGDACTYDVDAAKKLWASSGGLDGPINIWMNEGAGHEVWLTAVGNFWSQAFDVKYVLQQRPWAEYLDGLLAHTLDGPWRLGWIMDYPSAQNYLAPIYGQVAKDNNFGYENQEVDALYKEGNSAATVEEGLAKYNLAEDLILKDFPSIPMWFGRVLAAYSDNVLNLVVDKNGVPDFVNVAIQS